jgi:single-strand DNA-binding protein
MNIAIVSGNVGKEPEFRQTNTGKRVIQFSIADSPGRDKPPVWWRVSLWLGETDSEKPIIAALQKGKRVRVEGRAALNTYTPKEGGAERSVLELHASPMDLTLGIDTRGGPASSTPPTSSGPRQSAPPTAKTTPSSSEFDDDVPF